MSGLVGGLAGGLAGGSMTRRFRVLAGRSVVGLFEFEVRARRGRVLPGAASPSLAGGAVTFSPVSDAMRDELKASRLGNAAFGSTCKGEDS